MTIDIQSNLPEVVARFRAAAARAPLATQIALGRTAIEIGHQAESIVKAHTPVGDEQDRSGGSSVHLRDTTVMDPIGDVAFGRVSVVIRQTKNIPIRGKMVPLFAVLTSGHAAPVVPIRPVTAGALFWPGLGHPVASSKGGPADPNPYGEEARNEIRPLAALAIKQAGEAIAESVL